MFPGLALISLVLCFSGVSPLYLRIHSQADQPLFNATRIAALPCTGGLEAGASHVGRHLNRQSFRIALAGARVRLSLTATG